MKQLITRVDDELLERVKARARAQGVSMNTFVNRLLAQAAEADDRRRELERRIAEAGLSVEITLRRPAPSMERILEMTRGAGTAILDELLEERERERMGG